MGAKYMLTNYLNLFNVSYSEALLLAGINMLGIPIPEHLQALARLVDINFICDASKSMIDRLVKDGAVQQVVQALREDIGKNIQHIEPFLAPLETLRNVSQPCHKMILNCMWHDKQVNCSELFHPIETDYGYCCTFNQIPNTLLWKNL